ncbi:hypothetical protein AX760_04975 [Pararhizobium antarcticum]|uniref:Uncharacterized protein n=2 Tax=Pararhizobium antarcticum TaxID=1798805 RepID=A0A657LNV8_9HYPH|nr:hypothetical protein AX760_04975 [Pararhizobium antarcticum]OJF96019.1 hypothetical protein AX761_16710 [Rhizobium sp. 58]
MHRSPGFFRCLGWRLLAALPTGRQLLLGAPLWGLLMAVSAAITLLLREGEATFQLPKILLLFFAGGALAWPFSYFLGRFCALGRSAETRFAAYFLFLTVLTIAATAFLYAMDYRLFYARWHAPLGTRIWQYQFLYTTGAAVYQFVVLGIRLYLPFGLAALGATSLWLARRPHDMQR